MHAEPTGIAPHDLDMWRHPAVLLEDGRITAASEPALGVLGADAIGRRFTELVAVDDRFEAARRMEAREIGPPTRIGLLTPKGRCLVGMSGGISEPLRIASHVVDLAPLTRNVVDTIEAAHGVEITLTGSGSRVGDELRIRQVLRNLLINAVRYGGPDIRVDVRWRDGRVQIEVSDDGEGVDEADAELTFERFSSAHDTIEESVGVGFAVSRQLTIGTCYRGSSGRTSFVIDLAAG